MTLTTRLTVFFLSVLACVLVGLSVALYGLANSYLHREVDDRLNAALDTLIAAADISEAGVEWEPRSRAFNLGEDAGTEQVRWLVCDDRWQEVDRSKNLSSAELFKVLRTACPPTDAAGHLTLSHGEPWSVRHRWLPTPAANGAPTGGDPAPTSTEPTETIYPRLFISAGASLAAAEAATRTLLLTLIGLSAGLWLVAAAVGRLLCRRALRPVNQMADAARQMNALDWGTRLPNPGTRDELADLAGAFNDLLARLEESYERQRRFTGDASHQLRTPLAGLLGQLDVALLRERSTAEYRRVLQAVQGEGNRLRQIVETLLFLARADAEAARPEFSELDLADWLREHLRTWHAHPRYGDLSCEIGDDPNFRVATQAALLAQLVDNLLDNAAKYSPPGTPISIRLTADDRSIFCAIENQGRGIATDDLPHLFEPFYRAPEARQLGVSGVGLGLAVVQRIAGALGGEVHAENTAVGARFVFRLPRLSAGSAPTRPSHSLVEVSG